MGTRLAICPNQVVEQWRLRDDPGALVVSVAARSVQGGIEMVPG